MQWEEIWLLSLLPSVLCFYAISRNQVAAMQASITMTIMFGCGPLLYGAFIMMDDAFVFFTANQDKIRAAPLFFGFPVVMIRYMFIVGASNPRFRRLSSIQTHQRLEYARSQESVTRRFAVKKKT